MGFMKNIYLMSSNLFNFFFLFKFLTNSINLVSKSKMFPFEQYSKPQIIDLQSPKKYDNFLEQILSKENQAKCLSHSKEDIQFFCLNPQCNRNLVCTECLLEGLHEGHEVKKLDKLSEFWFDMLKSSEIKLKYFKESLELMHKKYEAAANSISQGFEQRKTEISKAFETLFCNLMNKQNEMIEFIDNQNKDIEIKQKEKLENLTEKIENCKEGLERIVYAENFQNMSIMDLSISFTIIKEIVHKNEQNNDFKIDMNQNFNYNQKNKYDVLLSKIANAQKIMQNCLNFNEFNLETNFLFDSSSKYLENLNKQRNSLADEDLLGPPIMKETISFAVEKSIKDSYLNINSDKKNGENSAFKRKLQEKYGNLLEVFKPNLAKSKLSSYNFENSKKNANSFYKTPDKKSVDNENSEERNQRNKYLYSLERQKLKYVNSAHKLI